ncbi:MAG TPA: hypothetical protein VMP67_00530 [Candidatus Limnocylindria bacterium]|nr:hypothetical protein [Candidatus Limnocylindria bacterium]
MSTPERSQEQREVPLAGPGAAPDELHELTGDQAPGDQVAFLRQDEVDDLGQLTDTDVYEGELEAGVHDDLPQEPVAENLELLTELELRAGETSNPDVAAEEGMTYVPPTDPPVVPSDDPQGAEVAAGFGATATDEPYDENHRSTALSSEDEMSARVREALRADAATSRYADSVSIGTRGRTVALRGVVDDVDDTYNVVEVVSRVSGVDEVIEELDVRGL